MRKKLFAEMGYNMERGQNYNRMKSRARKRLRRRRFRLRMLRLAIIIVAFSLVIVVFRKFKEGEGSFPAADSISPLKKEDDTPVYFTDDLSIQLQQLAKEDAELNTILHNRGEYPDEILNLLLNNIETKQFVLDYPEKKDKETDMDLSGDSKDGEVPLFLQWDERWGYLRYDSQMMATNGCGPACLSMVAVKVLGDSSMNPYWMAQYSEKNGYVENNATLWSFMSEGARALGLDVTEIPLDEKRVADNLNVGNPVICIMGPGDFTTSGHFIVLTGYSDGMVTVNDPNSISRSEKQWSFKEIAGQIRNLWVYR